MFKMEHCEVATPSAAQSLSPKSWSSSSSPPTSTPLVVISPCAACKILRRRCTDKCVLAPYFPPTEPAKFTIAHRVFGASNIIKFLQELPESQRADAKQVNELQAQLAKAQAEVVNMQLQQANLMALLCMEVVQSPPSPQRTLLQSVDDFIGNSPQSYESNPSFLGDNNLESLWESEPLWT
ncbi:hypothetical protein V6N11_067301 [Hibiscus sabdariffa]|uniref:LOB domain-containing protein n=1 Tax=Hibiscus sabdariffa TaxID=183260 RepID=A0ABR2SQC2_9ROSI